MSEQRILSITVQYQDQKFEIKHDMAQKSLLIGRRFLQELFSRNGNSFLNISRHHLEIGLDAAKDQVWAHDTSLLGTLVRIVDDSDQLGPEFLYHHDQFIIKRRMRLRLQNETAEREPDDVLIDIDNPCHDETRPILDAPPAWERLLSQLRTVRAAHLVGIPGSGKSTLAKKLIAPSGTAWQRQRDRQLGGAALVAWVDCRVWQEDSPLWRQLARRMLAAMHTAADEQYLFALRDELRTLLDTYDDSVDSLLGSINPIFRRALRLLRNENLRPLLVFDEFDSTFAQLDPFMLYQLYQFHQWPEIGESLSYTIVTRRPLEQLRDDVDDKGVSEFCDLFSRFTIQLGCLSADAFIRLWRHIAPENNHIDDTVVNQLYRLSGGHPGLTRELYQEVAINGWLGQPHEWVEQLEAVDWAERPPQSCMTIWHWLTVDEQQALLDAVHDRPLAGAVRQQLRDSTLLNDDDQAFSPLFGAVIGEFAEDRPQPHEGLYVDGRRQRVFVDSVDVTSKLHGRKLDVMLYLHRNAGRLCSYEDLIRQTVASDVPLDALSLEAERSALQRTVSRLCRVVDPQRRYIFNEQGQGYLLRYEQ